MRSSLISRAFSAGLFVLAVAGAPVQAQKTWEWEALGIATLADKDFFGAGLGLGYRTNGRMRIQVLANAGSRDGSFAFRPEALISFHLNPYKRRGISPYASGGVAFIFTEGDNVQYLVGVFGLETNPGGKWGWFLEAGIGGGARIAGGVQIRRRPSG
jgi:hypothetical protein